MKMTGILTMSSQALFKNVTFESTTGYLLLALDTGSTDEKVGNFFEFEWTTMFTAEPTPAPTPDFFHTGLSPAVAGLSMPF